MPTVSLKDAKTGLSSLVDEVFKGGFVTITRHGKPVAALVPIQAAEIARTALRKRRRGLAAYLRTFPASDEITRNPSPSRSVEL